ATPNRSPDEERGRLFEGLTQLVLPSTSHPLVLFVDDVHWADRTTVEWLRYLTFRLRDQAAFVALAYRDSDAPPYLNHVIATWERDGVARHVPLSRLGDDEATALLAL